MLTTAKISKFKLKNVISCYCIDIDATRTAKLVGVNYKTINRYFKVFRHIIYFHQMNDFLKLMGETELDESYFDTRIIRGYHGKLKRGRGTNKQPVFRILERNDRVLQR